MKRNTTAFLIIALAAQVRTTWFQKLRTATNIQGLYYPSFETLLIERLVVWFIIVAVLGTIWLLISKRTMRD